MQPVNVSLPESMPLVGRGGSALVDLTSLIDMPPEDDELLPPMLCEPLAGRCQQIETCLSVIGEVASIAGFIYSSMSGDLILSSFCGFTTLCFFTVIVTNKTCGSFPRIHREFLAASRRLERLKEREGTILERYQRQIEAFKTILDQNKEQVEMLHQLSEASKATSTTLQGSLEEMQKKYESLLQINKELKQSTAEKKQITESLQQNLEAFSGKILDFRTGIETVLSVTSEIKNTKDEIQKITSGVSSSHEEIKTLSDQVDSSQKNIGENELLKRQLQSIRDELKNEREINALLQTKNGELIGAINGLTEQLAAVSVAMEKDTADFKERKKIMMAEKEALEGLIAQAKKEAEERTHCCQSIHKTHEQLNEMLKATNAAILEQAGLLKRSRSDDGKSHISSS